MLKRLLPCALGGPAAFHLIFKVAALVHNGSRLVACGEKREKKKKKKSADSETKAARGTRRGDNAGSRGKHAAVNERSEFVDLLFQVGLHGCICHGCWRVTEPLIGFLLLKIEKN